MPKALAHKAGQVEMDDLLPHYDIDYSKARSNRFASPGNRPVMAVILDPEVAQVFNTTQKVNAALRSLLPAAAKPESRPIARRKSGK